MVAPEHTHPNVHSYEVGLSGDLWFSHGGKWIHPKHPAFHFYKKNRCIQVDNVHLHGASVGPKGGIFLSVQQWLNGVKYKKLHWSMAASKETRKPPWG